MDLRDSEKFTCLRWGVVVYPENALEGVKNYWLGVSAKYGHIIHQWKRNFMLITKKVSLMGKKIE